MWPHIHSCQRIHSWPWWTPSRTPETNLHHNIAINFQLMPSDLWLWTSRSETKSSSMPNSYAPHIHPKSSPTKMLVCTRLSPTSGKVPQHLCRFDRTCVHLHILADLAGQFFLAGLGPASTVFCKCSKCDLKWPSIGHQVPVENIFTYYLHLIHTHFLCLVYGIE